VYTAGAVWKLRDGDTALHSFQFHRRGGGQLLTAAHALAMFSLPPRGDWLFGALPGDGNDSARTQVEGSDSMEEGVAADESATPHLRAPAREGAEAVGPITPARQQKARGSDDGGSGRAAAASPAVQDYSSPIPARSAPHQFDSPYRSAQPGSAAAPAPEQLAGSSSAFKSAWKNYCDAVSARLGVYIDSNLTGVLMGLPLLLAESILRDISNPKIDRPVGWLIWRLRKETGSDVLSNSTAADNRQSTPRVAMSPSTVPPPPAKARASVSAQPQDALMPQLPLAIIDRGEAGNVAPERLHCMGCSLPTAFRRRVSRAGGVDQPQALHRFSRCGCGATASIIFHEHFAGLHLIDYMVIRPEPSETDRPSLLPAQQTAELVADTRAASAQPSMPVSRVAVEDLRCPACAEKLLLIVYDPVDHFRHVVEYSCARCREIFAGTVMGSGQRVLGTLMRTAAALPEESG
jgi:hypothetical protein